MSEVNQELNELEKKSKEILIELIEDQKHEIELLEERNKRLFAFKENAGHGLVSINVYKDKLEEIKELKEEIESLANINIKAQNIIAELKEKLRVDRQCEACKLGDLIVENTKLKEENEDLRKFAETLSENHTNEWQEQQQVITELRGKLEKVSEWVKEQEYPGGCIDCSFSETEKLKEILK